MNNWNLVQITMADHTANTILTEDEGMKSENNERRKEDLTSDPDFFSCLLQPSPPDSDPNYIGIRRILLHRKAQAGLLRRKVFIDASCLSIYHILNLQTVNYAYT